MNQASDQNVDVPPMEVPEEIVETKINVVGGSPGCGKSTLLGELESLDYTVKYEPAEQLLEEEIEAGKTAEDVRQDPIKWQKRVVRADFDLLKQMDPDVQAFIDTSLVETCVYSRRAGLNVGNNLKTFLQRFRFENIFFLEPLDTHETTEVRKEDRDTARELSEEIYETYQEFDYNPVRVPPVDPDERVSQVLDQLEDTT